MQPDLVDALDAQRSECAQAHVQRDARNLDAVAASASSICGVKCRPAVGAATEPRSRANTSDSARDRHRHRRDGCKAAAACGRSVEHCEEIVRRERTRAIVRRTAPRSRTSASSTISPLGAGKTSRSPMATLRPGGRGRATDFRRRAGEHDFDAAGGLLSFAAQRAARVEPRGNDAAVVEDEQIARRKRVANRRKGHPAMRPRRGPSPTCGSNRARREAAAQ